MKRLVFFFTLLWGLFFSLSAAEKVRVACVGNSITYGMKLANPAVESYPSQLQTLLGPDYEVGNFGKSGATLLYHGHRPYVQQEEYQDALRFKGDIVVIHLGINDTDPRNWPNYRDDFVHDYLALIDSFYEANPKARILLCRMTPIRHDHPRFASGTRDWHAEIQRAIETVAAIKGLQLIDLHEILYPYPHLLPDAVHPTKEGATRIAEAVFSAITGDYGGLQLPAIYSDNMVLQRNVPLTILGRTDARKTVEVRIGDQHQQVRAGWDGKWSVRLNPLDTGRVYTLTISSGDRQFVFRNILAGEVWLCSGQSNMEFRLRQDKEAETAISGSRDQIRLFNMQGRWATNNHAWPRTALDSVNRLDYYNDTRWEICNPETASRFSAVAYYFGKMLQDSLRVPIGLICNAVGGSPIEAWIDRQTLEENFPEILSNWTENDFIQDWVRGRALVNMGGEANAARHPYEPCYLFEAGILPLRHFPLRGVIWYQGESNAHNKDAYAKLFPLMVNSWRTFWDAPSLPVYYVQLSSLSRPSWPWFRDAQRQFLARVAHTGMVVSSDKGDSLDVHPTEKRPVGERLARWALNQTYHRDILPSGPLCRAAEAQADGSVLLSFDYAEGLRASDGQPLREFEVAEHDGLYFPATAEVEGENIRLRSSAVASPRYIRYGWRPYSRANLVNRDQLPASTFRIEVGR